MKIKKNYREPETVKRITDALMENHKLYGAPYCPCALEHIEDTMCMCREFRDNPDMTRCHCGLYIRE